MFKKQPVVSLLDVLDFTQLLHDAVHEGRCERVRSACDRVEEFLSHAGKEVRDSLAIEIFESIQNDLYPPGSETLARFLGPETKRLWRKSKRFGERPSSWICRIGLCWKAKY